MTKENSEPMSTTRASIHMRSFACFGGQISEEEAQIGEYISLALFGVSRCVCQQPWALSDLVLRVPWLRVCLQAQASPSLPCIPAPGYSQLVHATYLCGPLG